MSFVTFFLNSYNIGIMEALSLSDVSILFLSLYYSSSVLISNPDDIISHFCSMPTYITFVSKLLSLPHSSRQYKCFQYEILIHLIHNTEYNVNLHHPKYRHHSHNIYQRFLKSFYLPL